MSVEEKIDELMNLLKKIFMQKKNLQLFDTNYAYIFDSKESKWVIFKPTLENVSKLHGHYFSSSPDTLTPKEDGWSPLRIDSSGNLIVSDISTIKDDLALIKADIDTMNTAIGLIQAQTDLLVFEGTNSVLKVHETAPT